MSTGKLKPIFQIDCYLKGTERFWFRLEKHCVMECCRLDALDLSDEHILWASEAVNKAFLISKLENLILALEDQNHSKAQSREVLCFGGYSIMFIELFENIKYVILGIYT